MKKLLRDVKKEKLANNNKESCLKFELQLDKKN